MSTILVTGGAGYIGSHTVHELTRKGYRVVIFDNLSEGSREVVERLAPDAFVEGDLRNPADLAACFGAHRIEAVIHFAARAYVGESVTDPSLYYHNNVTGSLNLLRAMQDAGVDNLVMSSTCATYGEPEEVPISESTRQAPINPYGRSKLMMEQMILDFAHAYKLRSVIFRYFNAAGAHPEGLLGENHAPETHLIPLVLYAALGRIPCIRVFGDDYPTADGTCIRDYIHVSDLADAHVRGVQYLLDGGETVAINLGSEHGFSVQQIIDTARSVTGERIEAITEARRPGDPPVLIANAQRAREVLGWVTRHSDIEAVIRDAWNWHRRCHGGSRT